MNFVYEKNRISVKDECGATVAEVTYSDLTDDVVDINHTFVDNYLRGQGVASKLLTAVANHLREENKKAYPTCSYAVSWFEKNKDFHDVYSDNPNK